MDYASVERNLWLCMVTEEDLAVALHEVLEAPDTKAGDKLRCRVRRGHGLPPPTLSSTTRAVSACANLRQPCVRVARSS